MQGFPGIEGDELICERLAQENINVLTFNYQGTFQSEGFFSFSHVINGIGAAIQFIKELSNQEKYYVDFENLILGGWSFGSGIVPTAASRYADISRMFCISGRDFGAEAHRVSQNPTYAQEVYKNLKSIRKPDGPVSFQDNLLEDLINNQETLDSQKLAPKLNDCEILLIGGWNDEISPIEEHLIPFYRALLESGNPRVRIEVLNTDHEFSNSKDQLVERIVEWIEA